ncbi:hypothetical protein SteCoe_33354 [Stentor coeruleus]|uniref:G domain-containing protein n=1 Tax=Stentor coeruleus TaxID=5963 RepID=A0A1R2AWY9_9CILI|nr:hypothetical protein SteCoe_33354 [Stentor coeruleus]
MNSTFARAVSIDDIEPYDYSVLILGETRVGKSTLVNVIVNSVLGNNVENLTAAIRCKKYPNINPEFDDKIYKRNDANTLRSQTTNVHYYKVSGPLTNNKILLLVDTPGTCSTKGIEEDDESTNEIINCAKSVKHFNAIICMLKYSTNRSNVLFKYNIYRISKIIPRDFENSVIVVSSFKCGNRKFSEVRIDYPFPVQNFYFFNNFVFENSREEYLAKPKLVIKSNKKFKKIKTKVGKMIEFIFNMRAISNIQYEELFYHNKIKAIISELNTNRSNAEAIKRIIYTNEVIEGPLLTEDILKYYSIPITLKNPEKILKLIDIKEKKLLLELQSNELMIFEINPRYNLCDNFRIGTHNTNEPLEFYKSLLMKI